MRRLFWLALCATLSFSVSFVEAFGPKAHRLFGERAVTESTLDSFLRTNLQEFLSGTAEVIGGQSVIGLIRDGAVDEDKPAWRSLNHFHDPTKTWDQAGLAGLFTSSVIWGQTNQGFLYGGSYTWHEARTAYLGADKPI